MQVRGVLERAEFESLHDIFFAVFVLVLLGRWMAINY
jgi:hypothetical protein